MQVVEQAVHLATQVLADLRVRLVPDEDPRDAPVPCPGPVARGVGALEARLEGGTDFEISLRGRRVELEKFGLAEEVPLSLGLVIDTSLSMDTIIQETKAAALQFLTSVVTPRDEAFIVDFDTRPRLAVAMTPAFVAATSRIFSSRRRKDISRWAKL